MHGNLATSTVAEFQGRLRCKNTQTGKQMQIHIKKRFGSGRGGIAWRVERVILYFLSETCMGGAAAVARLKQKSGKQLHTNTNEQRQIQPLRYKHKYNWKWGACTFCPRPSSSIQVFREQLHSSTRILIRTDLEAFHPLPTKMKARISMSNTSFTIFSKRENYLHVVMDFSKEDTIRDGG